MSQVDLEALAEDVNAEYEVLAKLLERVAEDAWDVATPAPGWSVRDQITHLAFFDGITRLAITDPHEFENFRDGLTDLQEYVDKVSEHDSGRSGRDMLLWWAHERRELLDAALTADPARRVPWFGPDMSLASKLTARLMETWAHGQDIVDALNFDRPATSRLVHIARIGVLAFRNSFLVRGLDVPAVPVWVSLDAPDGGGTWVWGDSSATNRVSGPAEDFCLVVTQRRHVSDTSLEVVGETADLWMDIAQAFAGPPGEGRKPGQFPRSTRRAPTA